MEDSAVSDELLKEWPNAKLVLAQLFALFRRSAGLPAAETPADRVEEEAFLAWMVQNFDSTIARFYRRPPTLVKAVSSTISDKVSWISQLHCPLCNIGSDFIPSATIPIRIKAQSPQGRLRAAVLRDAFRRAIASRLADHPFEIDKHLRVCLQIVFVVNRSARPRDIDNLAKAILDALKDVLFGDDEQIDHLNLIKIETQDEEYVCLNFSESRLNQHNDVMLKRMHHGWEGAEALELEGIPVDSDDSAI